MKKKLTDGWQPWDCKATRLLRKQTVMAGSFIPIVAEKTHDERIDRVIAFVGMGFIYTWTFQSGPTIPNGKVNVLYPMIAG